MARRKTAYDGTPLTLKESWVGFGKNLRCVVEWVDDAGNVWDVTAMHITGAMVSKAHSGKSRAAKGAVKTEKVKVNFDEQAESRRVWIRILSGLGEKDAGRILERLKRKNPRDGIGVSGRDMRDIDRVVEGVFEELRRESMHRAVAPTPTQIFLEVLRDAHAAHTHI
jgi:hypothetical protein